MYTLSCVYFSFLVKPKLVEIYEASREGNCITVKWKKQNTGNCLLVYEVLFQSSITGEMVFTETIKNGELSLSYCSTTAAEVNSTSVKAIKGKESGELNSCAVVIKLKPPGKN